MQHCQFCEKAHQHICIPCREDLKQTAHQNHNRDYTILLIGTETQLVIFPALHYSLDFIFLSFGIMGFIVELRNY